MNGASNFHVVCLVVLVLNTAQGVASLPCNSTAACESLFRTGSTCVDGSCTNPFTSGCLRRILGKEVFPRARSCNSEDPEGSEEAGVCSSSPLRYNEVRISPGNWESAMFYAWIVQIVLSELADVPVSIEVGDGLKSGSGRTLSFYDPQNAFSYPSFSLDSFAAMREGDRVGDCRLNLGNGRQCAHFMPEVWFARKEWWEEAAAEGYIKRPNWNGMLGGNDWFVPKFLGEEDPSLTTHWGLRGEGNRRKLANTFKRPTTWGYYCRNLSPTACGEDDGVAVRPPEGEIERASYFADGLYTGHFRYTVKNNCTLNPANCTGHIADYPCEWASAFTQSVLHWNDIALESDGPNELGTYPYKAMIEIFFAANATRSPVMVVWWAPEVNIENFQLQPVDLPVSTVECLSNRPYYKEASNPGWRCGMDKEDLIGIKSEGGCGPEMQPLQKVIVSSLSKDTFHQQEAIRSPAYEILKDISVSDMSLVSIMDVWWRRGIDTYGYDPREAVCSWVAANVDELRKVVPPGYPREVKVVDIYDDPLLHVALVLGVIVAALALLTLLATCRMRKVAVMKYAQVDFLYMFCLGNLLVSVAGIVVAANPSLASCATRPWLLVLGYTLGLVPLLVKAAAINKLMQDSMNMKRARISRKHLYAIVAGSVALAIAFLTAWTVVDRQTRVEDYVLVGGEGSNVVEVRPDCSSTSSVWAIVAFVWDALLVFGATILSFQSRNVRQEFNESKILGNMAYSRFFFLSCRILVLFGMKGVEPALRNGILSLLYSFDSLFSLLIYFGPKLLLVFAKSNHKETKSGSQEAPSNPSSEKRWVNNDSVKRISHSVQVANVASTENFRDDESINHELMVTPWTNSVNGVADTDNKCEHKDETPTNTELCPQVSQPACKEDCTLWSKNLKMDEGANQPNQYEQDEKIHAWFDRASGVFTRKRASLIVQRASNAFLSTFLAEC